MGLYVGSRLSRTAPLTFFRKYSSSTILGIETSCDDTGVGIVKEDGKSKEIIAESLFSQHKTHNRFGGIIPPIAQTHHRQNIEIAVKNCLEKGKLTLDQIDAIAVTNRPGLPMSLEVGVRYAKHLSRQFKKPIIPIHHMEAHALTARLSHEIPFPFICLLISGGHCQLVLVKNVNSFYLLGETIDDAPGEILDKIARRLKLKNLPGYEDLNGGQAIELAASQADQSVKWDVTLPVPLLRYRDCQFSFAGIKNNSRRVLDQIEAEIGLPMSLEVGVRYAKHLSRQFKKPIIPIHHMEAHALTARLSHEIPFPFICLLISGGHCQLVLVKNVNSFYLLGETIDDAPGEILDKIARRLKLKNLPGYEDLNGGQAIELAASQADQSVKWDVTLPVPLLRYRDCQFSFAGIKNNSRRVLDQIEAEIGTRPDEVIPTYREFCRSLLIAVSTHLSHRVQRCIEYCLQKNMLSDIQTRSLVISGGVAANDFIFDTLTEVVSAFGFKTFRPEKSLCSDNGVMIAWNGIERLALSSECFCNIDSISVSGKCSLGESLIADVKEADLKCKWVKVPKVGLIKSHM